jgi:hypothetical protein
LAADEASGLSRVAIVSCDIVGHSSESDLQVQFARVQAINGIIAAAIEDLGADSVVWASGGDGGHIIFRDMRWHQPALDLIAVLRRWAAAERVPLRVTANVGFVSFLSGADGRVQAVGDGINLAGWLLTRGPARGVLVSAPFQAEIEATHVTPEATFDNHRKLRDKAGRDQYLALMSIGPDRSSWDPPTEEDRRQLADAVRGGAGWEIIYWAKRILQINDGDSKAAGAIRRLPRRHLGYSREDVRGEANPFFELLTYSQLHEVIMAGHLVERRYNEYICRLGDAGDTMFVILRGQVGVYLPPSEGASDTPAQPDFVHEEGEIVGELAFAMSRRRTADLVALTDTTLLTFNFKEMSKRLPDNVLDDVRAFMRSRALEHVSQRVPFLIGPDQRGPLIDGEHPWEEVLASLEEHCTLIQLPRTQSTQLTFGRVKATSPDAAEGLYLLVGGALRGLTEPDPRRPSQTGVGSLRSPTLIGEAYPLLWVDLPGTIVLPKRDFHIEGEPVTILYLRASGLVLLDALQRDAVYRELRRAAAACFEYDAFISYNSGDADTADRWATALTNAGLNVFRDVPTRGTEFPPRLWAAIRHARALVPLVSPHVMVREAPDNWVMREIDAHRHYFDVRRIFPVILPGGKHEHFLSGFRPIRVGDDETVAIGELVEELRALRDGSFDPPLSFTDKGIPPNGSDDLLR